MLKVKKLNSLAFLPTVGHPGEDLGFDLYSLAGVVLTPFQTTVVTTGISAKFVSSNNAVYEGSDWLRRFGLFTETTNYGLIIKDRSSMAAKGVHVSAGVVDSGYAGEIKVLLTYIPLGFTKRMLAGDYLIHEFIIHRGDKIAQMIPQAVSTSAPIVEVDDLGDSSRGEGGFGSTGSSNTSLYDHLAGTWGI